MQYAQSWNKIIKAKKSQVYMNKLVEFKFTRVKADEISLVD